MVAILKNLGLDSYFETQCAELQIKLDSVARVTAEHKGLFYVKNSRGEFQARISGKQMFVATSREDYPVVGDWVEIAIIDNGQAIINQILPRKTVLRKAAVSRKSPDKVKSQIIAANVDVAFVVESVDRDYSLNRLERYFALASAGKIIPSIILNKADLVSEDEITGMIAEIRQRFNNCVVLSTSTTTQQGLNSLKDSIQAGKTYCFLGSSGVGKSSLINALIGESVVKTGAIGSSSGRGKHVTTHREMYMLDSGGVVIDNPGMREVGMANSEAGVSATFREVEDFASECLFSDCTHTHESDCAVLRAVDSGELSRERYENYIRLKKESEHYDMSEFERRGKDKKFGRSIKNYHKRMKKFE